MDSNPPRPTASSATASVLLVDDDPVIRRSYGDQLRAEGFELTVLADGYDVLQMSGERRFDVLLLDLRMPHRNGADVLRALRAKPSFEGTVVFLLAQPGDANLVDQAMREGAELVLEKARVTPRDVVDQVRSFLQASRTDHPAVPGPESPAPLPPPAVAEPPDSSEASFVTVLHRYVGESARLAETLGLSEDFLCPACRQQLALRLWPDRTMESGVRGHFFCPGCAA
jgi:CheY-like chemotaxis protein